VAAAERAGRGVWDFTAYGGSFGEDDATALVAAARLAVASGARC
jgi:hypothetical protein